MLAHRTSSSEPGESWEQTLRREMDEKACATVVGARLLGFTRGQCVAGPERGLVLVRSVWRADVEDALSLGANPFAPFIRRELREAAM
jgi:hypothetical protein